MSGLGVDADEPEDDDDDDSTGLNDPRKWTKVIDAYEQPRVLYNISKKHFER
jgi:DNA polymerase epsilon subunit 2